MPLELVRLRSNAEQETCTEVAILCGVVGSDGQARPAFAWPSASLQAEHKVLCRGVADTHGGLLLDNSKCCANRAPSSSFEWPRCSQHSRWDFERSSSRERAHFLCLKTSSYLTSKIQQFFELYEWFIKIINYFYNLRFLCHNVKMSKCHFRFSSCQNPHYNI